MDSKLHRELVTEQVGRVQRLMLDTIELITERVNSDLIGPPPLPHPPVEVARRQMANMLDIWQVCPRAGCRRSRSCQGEPLHCLRFGIPAVPPAALEKFLSGRKRPSRWPRW